MAAISKPVESIVEAARAARGIPFSITALGVGIAVLYLGRVVFVTAFLAIVIAMILEPGVALLMRLRLPRSVASFMVCALALLSLYVLGMGAYAQLSGLYGDLPTYGQRIGDIVDGVRLKVQSVEDETYRTLAPSRQRQAELEREKEAARKPKGKKQADVLPAAPAPAPPAPPPIGDYIYSHLSSLYEAILMASFIPFLVYFMLSWQDHVNRSFLQLFREEVRPIVARSVAGIGEMVRAFVVGNFLLGLFLAVIGTAAFWAIGVPYPMLVGPLSALFSLVPYVGLPLAVLPPLLAALEINQVSVYVLVAAITGGLHLIALNVFYPKIVGSRVHLNPLVVTFSLMLWGFLWGGPGLLLAIPLTAGVKAVCDNVETLRAFGEFLGD